MSQTVRFVAYHAPAAPAGRQFLAQIFVLPDATPKAPNPAETPISMNFWASARPVALAAAERWWDAEQEKIATRDSGFAERAAKARATKAQRSAA